MNNLLNYQIMEKRVYERPQIEVMEIVVEQVLLAASTGYPGYGEEYPL